MSDNIMPMAWNEPGDGSKNNNPWGKKNTSDGPPDLDEIFRNLFNKIKSLSKHYSYVKTGDSDRAVYMKDSSFWELIKE